MARTKAIRTSAWLFKTEPAGYSFADLERDGRTTWDGITNSLALIHLREVRRGDDIALYHSGGERAVVGLARAASDAYPDPKLDDAKLVVVDVEPLRRLAQPVTLAAMKAHPAFKDFALVRISRLSVMPVGAVVWTEIMKLAGERPARRGPK